VASSGVGSTQHLALERFKLATGTQMIHVPYKGSGQAVIDLMGGHVDANFDGLGVVLPYVRAGKLRALGVGTMNRVPQMPELPTIHEQGLSGYQSGSCSGYSPPQARRAKSSTAGRTQCATCSLRLSSPIASSRWASGGKTEHTRGIRGVC